MTTKATFSCPIAMAWETFSWVGIFFFQGVHKNELKRLRQPSTYLDFGFQSSFVMLISS